MRRDGRPDPVPPLGFLGTRVCGPRPWRWAPSAELADSRACPAHPLQPRLSGRSAPRRSAGSSGSASSPHACPSHARHTPAVPAGRRAPLQRRPPAIPDTVRTTAPELETRGTSPSIYTDSAPTEPGHPGRGLLGAGPGRGRGLGGAGRPACRSRHLVAGRRRRGANLAQASSESGPSPAARLRRPSSSEPVCPRKEQTLAGGGQGRRDASAGHQRTPPPPHRSKPHRSASGPPGQRASGRSHEGLFPSGPWRSRAQQ
ncbi:translation initiation factor IF-2-like [Phacochoerus africanus]|uniref:translation initiation factor IF-2-like n=1 Tax=Phacochoerus africanus TaxID=41426 RepID=UPI001FD991CA|nr:translation initiation factor IF-2-like [Phacochoerus africanus]